MFAYKLCTESYGDSYADSDTCRRPLSTGMGHEMSSTPGFVKSCSLSWGLGRHRKKIPEKNELATTALTIAFSIHVGDMSEVVTSRISD
jgi:hypothetical protein